MSTYDSRYEKLCRDFITQKDELEAAKIKLLNFESKLDGWFLDRSSVNEFVEASLNNLIDRAKACCICDIDLRENGENIHFEADWIKYIVRVKP